MERLALLKCVLVRSFRRVLTAFFVIVSKLITRISKMNLYLFCLSLASAELPEEKGVSINF